LWPFSVFGWPEETPDYKYFYPTSILETGYDILFFWVARMVMDGIEFTGQVPFHTVYLHGMIRDEKGQKMSKTKNNVIDPLILMDEYGTDALRFTLLVGSSPGNDQNVGVKKVEANRNFANKVWNIGRYVINAIDRIETKANDAPDWTLADGWIWARLKQTVNSVNSLFEAYQYGEAGKQIYEFLWNDFADWYVEGSKRQLAEGGNRSAYTAYTLAFVLDTMLRLLHPFTPFVTEALWGYLKKACEESGLVYTPDEGWPADLMIAKWPEAMVLDGKEDYYLREFGLVQDIVRAIRNVRSEYRIEPNKKLKAAMVSEELIALLEAQKEVIADFANLDLDSLKVSASPIDAEGLTALVVDRVEVFLQLRSDGDDEADRERLTKELEEAESHIKRLEALLASPFAQKAPEKVVAGERQKLGDYLATAEKLRERLG